MVPSPGEQARILEQQARCCIYCDRPFGGDVRVTWDHFVPWSYSQRNEKFVAACQRCNSKKSDKMFQTLEEARAYLESVLHKV
jgi:5-methylcytosine-specific restriction endonuclease McrA